MKAEDIEKLAEEAWLEDQQDNPYPINPHSFAYAFIMGYKAAQSDLEENSTCACGDVFNANFKGVCPNCVAAQPHKEIERLSNIITFFDTKETPMKIQKAINWVDRKIQLYRNELKNETSDVNWFNAKVDALEDIRPYLQSLQSESVPKQEGG